MASSDGKPWCVEPFTTLESKVWGDWGLCCRSKPLPYNARDVTPLEHFNGDSMNRIRKDMINHNITDEIKHLCAKCMEHERNGVESRREGMMRVPVPDTNSDGSITNFKFRSIEIKFFGNLCNLKCRMCGPLYSSSIAAEQKKSGQWNGPVHHNTWNEYTAQNKSRFYEDMAEVLPHTREVKFTGGEPMMNKGILDFVEWMVVSGHASNLQLRIITNGTVINEDFLNFAKHFEQFHATISVDGVFDVDEYQRVGTRFEIVHKNIQLFKKYGSISLTTAITAINVSTLHEIQDYADSINIHLDLSSIVLTPEYLQVKVLPPWHRAMLLNKYSYNDVVTNALKDPEWPEDQWALFKEKCSDIFEVIPELAVDIR